MNWNRIYKEYFTFSKKDRIGAIVALIIIFFLLFIPQFFKKTTPKAFITEDVELKQAVDTLQQRQETTNELAEGNRNFNAYQYEPSETNSFSKDAALFAFDPNTLSLAGWKDLGLNNRTIKTINNYRSKGGKFYKPEDLQKIWGMPSGFYERVKDYIKIASTNRFENNTYATNTAEKREKLKVVEINEADTSALIALPGIGSKLSSRIIAFRNKLGGFYSINQVSETYGLQDSTFQKVKPFLRADVGAVKKININTATKDELKTHPYIRWNIANAIVEYRNQHGKYNNLEELSKIAVIDNVTYQKLTPYLSL
jgi:competence protein ComEA